MRNYELIKENRGKAITATFKPDGKRYRFYAAEHANVGDGWMLIELDGKLPEQIYSEDSIEDLEFSEMEKPWPMICAERLNRVS